MTEKNFKRLKPKYERLRRVIAKGQGFDNYEKSMKAARSEIDKHGMPLVNSVYLQAKLIEPTPDTVPLDRMSAVLEQIDSDEKAEAVLAGFLDEDVPALENLFNSVLREYLPAKKQAAKLHAKHYPDVPRGGRKSVAPPQSEWADICKQISELNECGVDLGIAQQRVAERTVLSNGKKMTKRMAQRIWGARKTQEHPPN